MYRKILIPLDGSKQGEKALDCGEHLARIDNAEICLVRMLATQVLTVGHPVPQQVIEDEIRDTKAYLDHVAVELRAKGFTVETDYGLLDPASGILNAVDDHEIDLVVMTSHGRTGTNRFLLGSVAERVARHARCPVLLVGKASRKPQQPTAMAAAQSL